MSDDEIRALERTTRLEGTAASWARLAEARARSGFATEACEAAVQALLREPSHACRRFLPPEGPVFRPGWRAPWRGLARPGKTRAVAGSGSFAHAIDLGEGRIAFEGRYPGLPLVAVDIFTGEEVWRFRNDGPRFVIVGVVGDDVLLLENRGIVHVIRIDRRTGKLKGRLPTPWAHDEDEWPPHRWELCVQRIEGIEIVTICPRVSLDATAVHLHLEGSHCILEEFPGFETLALFDEGAILQQPRAVLGMGRGLDELWRLDGFELVDVSTNVLVRRGVEFRVLDPLRGEVLVERHDPTLAAHWFGGAASRPCFVLGRQERGTSSPTNLRVAALDRWTLEVRWRALFEGYCGIASTADLTIVITHSRVQGERAVVRALDAGTGEERWRCEVHHDIEPGNPALVAGHLVLPGQGDEPLVVLAPHFEETSSG